mgnify:CR=1 FL=1
MGTGVGVALVGTAAVGAIVGGLAGKGVAEMVDPTAEDAYWRETSSLDWDRAKHATRGAWSRLSDRVERATPGDSDRDGK